MRKARVSAITKLSMIVFVILCAAAVFALQLKANSLQTEKQRLLEEITKEEARLEELNNKIDAPFDEEYIKSEAKSKLNLVMPDEVIFYNDIGK